MDRQRNLADNKPRRISRDKKCGGCVGGTCDVKEEAPRL